MFLLLSTYPTLHSFHIFIVHCLISLTSSGPSSYSCPPHTCYPHLKLTFRKLLVCLRRPPPCTPTSPKLETAPISCQQNTGRSSRFGIPMALSASPSHFYDTCHDHRLGGFACLLDLPIPIQLSISLKSFNDDAD